MSLFLLSCAKPFVSLLGVASFAFLTKVEIAEPALLAPDAAPLEAPRRAVPRPAEPPAPPKAVPTKPAPKKE